MEIALSTIEECIVWTNAVGKIKWCNASFEQLLGRPRLFLLEQSALACLPLWAGGQPIAEDAHPVTIAQTTGAHDKRDFEFRNGDRAIVLEIAWSFVEIDTSSSPQDDTSSVVLVLRDVTQQRQALQRQKQIEAFLEEQVACRTRELQEANEKLHRETIQLRELLAELKRTQSQLFQAEKMSSLGQLVAGIAHEINNPVSFIYGNLDYMQSHANDLLDFVDLHETHYPEPPLAIVEKATEIDLDFLRADLPKLVASMKVGADRIRHIVLSLRTFSRMDEAVSKEADLHAGLDSTLLILQHRLKAIPGRGEIEVRRDFGELPLVECCPGELNQVFMNVLSNAIDAIEDRIEHSFLTESEPHRGCITIQTANEAGWIAVRIADNGSGVSDRVRDKIFNPFFTTKPAGKGTGLGMSICHQIVVEKHAGRLECRSQPDGTEFAIHIPIERQES